MIDHLSVEYEVIGCPVNQFEKQGLKRSGEGGIGSERQFALYSSFLDVVNLLFSSRITRVAVSLECILLGGLLVKYQIRFG